MENYTVRAGTKRNLQDIVEAIKTLKRIEIHGQEVGPKEQTALAKFTGFGAVATKAFPDPITGDYPAGYEYLGEELRELLTDEEYESAKATTFSAFYTDPIVMRAMYRGLERMGIFPGSVGLEPGCGIGNFIGATPDDFSFIGVEQDSISGRIAKLLNPEADIRIEGFEDTELPDSSVDFAIGNVPFADIKLRHNDGKLYSLHDFFFLKSLDAVRPGGAMALVTSRYTMDKADPTVRTLLGQQADFVGAIRLPNGAFKDQGTEVVTDIIFLRKKPTAIDVGLEEPNTATTSDQVGAQPTRRLSEIEGWKPDNTTWLSASPANLEGGQATINDYFQAHKEMILGNMSLGHGMYNSQTLRVRSDGELAAALHAAMDGLPENIVTLRSEPLATDKQLVANKTSERDPSLPSHVTEGSFYIASDKTILQVTGGRGEPLILRDEPLSSNGTPSGKKLAALITLRDLARVVLKTQHDGLDDEAREAARQRLRTVYASFKARFGPINKTSVSERQDGAITRRMPNLLRFRADPDVYLVMALEDYDERTGKATPAAIMHRDVVAAPAPVLAVSTAQDGLVASLNQRGRVDLAFIARIYGKGEQDIVEELAQLIFFDPAEDRYVPADEYLSGNVRTKLRLAEASNDPRTRGNSQALAAVQPEDLVAEEIDVTLGTPWIPASDVKQFLAETMSVSATTLSVEYVAKEALWKVRPGSTSHRRTAVASSEFGTSEVDAYTLAEQALNMRTPTVRKKIPGGPGEPDQFVVDQEATVSAREKQSALKERFGAWAFEEPVRSDRLVAYYNEHFNNVRLRSFDGSHLTFPRMSSAILMRPHQKDAIWRNMAGGNSLMAHVVGAGKTFTMIAAGMEMKRTGLVHKPLFVIPNHMIEQFAREYLVLYPDANILVATKEDLTKTRRQLLKSRMATGSWDGIIMTHSSFEKIAMSPGFQKAFVDRQVQEYEDLLTTVTDRSLSRNITKKIEKLKAGHRAKTKDLIKAASKDGGLFFDELGIDQLFIDEAHMFKNLETPTKMDRVAGIQTSGSQRAFDLLMKARYLQSKTPGRGLTFATGTPVSNSLGEMYTMMRYLMPDQLESRGIGHFDAWAANFGEVVNSLEISPDGQSLRVNTRFAKFKNLPELLSLFRMSADVQTSEMLQLPVPALKGGKAAIIAVPMTDDEVDVQSGLVQRYERVRSGGVDPRDDNALKIITDGRKLALDGRLVDPNAEDHHDSKVNRLVDEVYEIWEKTKSSRSTQMIFSDLGVSGGKGFSVYDDIIEKLEARGVPREEIADIGDASTDQKKASLFATVRSGRVRILLGSTAKMGTGTNVQAKLYALHHLDPPWRPADIEQREGRILRQGNSNAEVEIYRYVTEGSFDAFMWQTLETKARFIAQAMAGDAGTRRADDIGGAELSFAEVKAIATGNPALLVLAEMDLELRQLTLLRKAHLRDQAKIAAAVQQLPAEIAKLEQAIADLDVDLARRTDTKGDAFAMTVGNLLFKIDPKAKRTPRQRAQDTLALAVAKAHSRNAGERRWSETLGSLGGLDVVLMAKPDPYRDNGRLHIALQGAGTYKVSHIDQPLQCPPLIAKLERTLNDLDTPLALQRRDHAALSADLERYQERCSNPFGQEATYQALRPLRDRLKTLLRQQENAEGETPVHEEIRTIIDQYRGMTLTPDAPETPIDTVDDVGASARVEAEFVETSPPNREESLSLDSTPLCQDSWRLWGEPEDLHSSSSFLPSRHS